MRTINVKPVESILIKLKDKDFVCTFNMLAMAHMQEAINKLDCRLDEIAPAHMTALVLYSGIKVNEPDFTMEEANALAMQMDVSCYGEIMGAYNEVMFDSMGDEEKAALKKMTAQYLQNAQM